MENLMFMAYNRSAELTKYAANAMLATRISFMNELANLTRIARGRHRSGAQGQSVRTLRIGYSHLYSGCGFGGSCFPKDLRALLHTAEHNGMPVASVARSVTDVNDSQRHILFSKLKAQFPRGLAGKSIAILGPGVQAATPMTWREAPSRYLMDALWAEGPACRPMTRKPCPNADAFMATATTCTCAPPATTPWKMPMRW